jgi:hypothetical protein
MPKDSYLENFQNIVLIPALGNSSLDSFLSNLGDSLHIATDLAQAEFMAIPLKSPLIILEVDSSSAELQEILKTLSKKINLLTHPILLVGNEPLEQKAKHLGLLGKKCKVLEIYGDEVQISNQLNSAIGVDLNVEKNVKKFTIKDFSHISGFIFHSPSSPTQAILTGLSYVDLTNENSLKNRNWLPDERTFEDQIKFIEDNSTKWELAHLHRTTFLSNQILKTVSISNENLELAKTTSFLLNYPNLLGREDLSKARYIRRGQEEIRANYAELLISNSTHLLEVENLSDISKIISKIAQTILEECEADESIDSKIASAIALSDILGREAWQADACDNRACYFLLRWLEKKSFSSYDPEILSQLIQVVVSSNVKHGDFSEPDQRESKSRTNLLIPELQSNMIVDRDLFSDSGKILVEAKTKLDPDIIWRLWRLSTLIPIKNVKVMR